MYAFSFLANGQRTLQPLVRVASITVDDDVPTYIYEQDWSDVRRPGLTPQPIINNDTPHISQFPSTSHNQQYSYNRSCLHNHPFLLLSLLPFLLFPAILLPSLGEGPGWVFYSFTLFPFPAILLPLPWGGAGGGYFTPHLSPLNAPSLGEGSGVGITFSPSVSRLHPSRGTCCGSH